MNTYKYDWFPKKKPEGEEEEVGQGLEDSIGKVEVFPIEINKAKLSQRENDFVGNPCHREYYG